MLSWTFGVQWRQNVGSNPVYDNIFLNVMELRNYTCDPESLQGDVLRSNDVLVHYFLCSSSRTRKIMMTGAKVVNSS